MAVGEAPQIRSLTELAEAAAAAGDYASAARHLHSLATLQEGELGPAHPDLANTLNNLAVAAERAGDLDTAEGAFRRASVITRAAFAADHPSVTTSARNLRDFCEAHGRPHEAPAALPIPVIEAVPAPSPVPTRSLTRLAGLGAVAGLVVASVLVWLLTDRTGAPPSAPAATAPMAPATERANGSTPTPTRATGPPPKAMPTPAAPVSTPVPARVSSSASVVTATVCSDFSTAGGEWRCTPVTDTTAAGRFVFYTRVKAAEPTTIEHRWYHGDSLVQRVDLQVSANSSAGYRTFSRQTVSERAGSWRVELRAADGAVLAEQSFVVQ